MRAAPTGPKALYAPVLTLVVAAGFLMSAALPAAAAPPSDPAPQAVTLDAPRALADAPHQSRIAQVRLAPGPSRTPLGDRSRDPHSSPTHPRASLAAPSRPVAPPSIRAPHGPSLGCELCARAGRRAAPSTAPPVFPT